MQLTPARLFVALAVLATGCRADIEVKRERAIAAVTPADGPATTVTSAAPPVQAGGAGVTPTGVVVNVVGPAEGGWLVGTPCGKTATVSAVRSATGAVVLDAGHGGQETGAVGQLGHEEGALNLAVVAHARQALAAAGISVVSTRTGDYRVAIPARAAIVGAVKPKAVVSIHHNASFYELRDTPGTEIFHQAVGTGAAESRRLAGLVYEEVTRTLARMELTEWASTARPGAKPRRNSAGEDFYGMLRRTKGTPTVLAEIGFLDHEDEERLYAQPAVQKAVGEAVALGIVRFLTTTDPGSGFVVPPRLADDNRQGGGTENCQDPPLE
jgi:N-acetylmuramoyl-L-alanine amidase